MSRALKEARYGPWLRSLGTELEIDRLVVAECHVNDPTRLGKTVIRAVQLMKHAAYGKDGWLHMISLRLCDSTSVFR
jgi:hypothetical protein